MASEYHRLWPERFVEDFLGLDFRTVLWGFITVALLCGGLFAGIHVRAIYRMESELALTTLKVQTLEQELVACKNLNAKQLGDLETTVYGAPNIEKRKPTIIEQWSLQRDKELRDRLKQLELWRYRAEKEKR